MRFISTLCLLLLELFCFAQKNEEQKFPVLIYNKGAKQIDSIIANSICKQVDLQNGLTGKIEGFNIQSSDSGVFSSKRITLRCIRTVNENTQPMLIVDGLIAELRLLSEINPNEIKEVAILKSAEATAIYGPDGANGALIVTTIKPGQNKIKIKDSYDGKAIPGATITFISLNKKDTTMLIADDDGMVLFDKQKVSPASEYHISSVGYKSFNINGSFHILNDSEFKLERDVKMCNEVVVVNPCVIRCGRECGYNCGRRKCIIVKKESVSDIISQTGESKSLKVFPNPVQKGNSIQIELNIQSENFADIKLISLDGKSLFTQKQKIFKGPNRLTINSDPRWSAGIYFIQLYAKGKLLASVKVVIQ